MHQKQYKVLTSTEPEYITSVVEADSPVEIISNKLFITNCPIDVDIILEEESVQELIVEPLTIYQFTEVTFTWYGFYSYSYCTLNAYNKYNPKELLPLNSRDTGEKFNCPKG